MEFRLEFRGAVEPSSFSNNSIAARGMTPITTKVSLYIEGSAAKITGVGSGSCCHGFHNSPIESRSSSPEGPEVPIVYDFPAPDWP